MTASKTWSYYRETRKCASPLCSPLSFLLEAGVAQLWARINDEMNEMIHPLQKLQPEAWNNIPICLVRAVKTLIDSGISTDQKLR